MLSKTIIVPLVPTHCTSNLNLRHSRAAESIRYGKCNSNRILFVRQNKFGFSRKFSSTQQLNQTSVGRIYAKPWWKFWEGKEKKIGENGEEIEEDVEVEVERILGVRYLRGENNSIQGIEYKLRWKDDKEDSWEIAQNVGEDLLRDYEASWWEAAKKGDDFVLREYLSSGEEVLINAEDKERRTALHYACGIGNPKAATALLEFGADPNAEDKAGYTPLHIAAGYVHAAITRDLLQKGADPDRKDVKGRSTLDLVFDQKRRLPAGSPQYFRRRNALEDVSMALVNQCFEEVPVKQVVGNRRVKLSTGEVLGEDEEVPEGEIVEMQYKVVWADAEEHVEGGFVAGEGEEEDDGTEWVIDEFVAQDLIDDWKQGLEYCDAEKVLDKAKIKGVEHYLVQWSDGSTPTWEPADHLTEYVISLMDTQATKQSNDKSKNSYVI